MKKIFFICLITAWVFPSIIKGDTLSSGIEEQPPVVVTTVPASGAKDVDPSTSEIRVTFSKEMMDKSWSWVQIAPENFPVMTGGPRYLEDKKTCVLNVRLESGKTYIIWLNTQKFGNFKDISGRSALPYLLMFDTRK